MSEEFEKAADQAAAFQKIWMESMSKVMQTAFTTGPSTPPPEILKQIRSGIFQALAQSWEEFMRSPQFTESMKQWMDHAIHFRKMTNDFMAKVRNETQGVSRNDIDDVMLSVRHMEKRLLDRMERLGEEVAGLKGGSAKRMRKNGKATNGRKKARVKV